MLWYDQGWGKEGGGGNVTLTKESVGCSAVAAAAVRLRSEKVTIRITIQRCYVTVGAR